jgi:two-component system OmpR family response regulator
MKPHILIVEDERNIGIGLKYNCEAEGYSATLVGDGPTALRLLQEDSTKPDLIILDLMLPGMSGYAVLETLRKADHQMPVLILSARTLAEDRTRGFDLGADQYLMKPFELPELLSRVRNLLQRRGQIRKPENQDDIYQFQGHTINFTRHEVVSNGESKTLTPLEFELLRYFVHNEGIVVTRNQLLDRVWGLESSPTTRTVDNFILRLRRYFEQDPARPRHFLSIRGVGYKFVKEPAPMTDVAEESAGNGDE